MVMEPVILTTPLGLVIFVYTSKAVSEQVMKRVGSVW